MDELTKPLRLVIVVLVTLLLLELPTLLELLTLLLLLLEQPAATTASRAPVAARARYLYFICVKPPNIQ